MTQELLTQVQQTLERTREVPATGFFYENGEPYTTEFERINQSTIEEIYVDPEMPTEIRDEILSHAEEHSTEIGQCYKNALTFAKHHQNAEYIEGYAILGKSGIAQSHAWNTIDGYLLDLTTNHAAGVGVEIPSHHVEKAYQLGETEGWWGVVTNQLYDGLP